MRKAITYVITAGILWLIVCAIRPCWNWYLVKADLHAAALYGTKRSIKDTRELLEEKLSERGVDFDPQDFQIKKDEDNTVSIILFYNDKIRFLGKTLKELEFHLEATEEETQESF